MDDMKRFLSNRKAKVGFVDKKIVPEANYFTLSQ